MPQAFRLERHVTSQVVYSLFKCVNINNKRDASDASSRHLVSDYTSVRPEDALFIQASQSYVAVTPFYFISFASLFFLFLSRVSATRQTCCLVLCLPRTRLRQRGFVTRLLWNDMRLLMRSIRDRL